MSLNEAVRAEVERIHVVFEDWLAGREGASLEGADSVLSEGFRLVAPSGEELQRERLLAGVASARGGRGEDFRIEVRNVDARELDGGLVLCTYEEWQEHGEDGLLGRLSSALLRRREGGGFDWLHVHETWMPGRGPNG